MSESDEGAERARGVRRVLLVTLALNALVAAAKVGYGSYADALAIRADGFHSAMDGLGNVAALLAASAAARPPDEQHPYGHRKIEVVVAALVGAILLVTARDLGGDAIARLFSRGPVVVPIIDAWAFAVLLGTLSINLCVTIWEMRAGRRWKSPLLVTDAMHTRSDVVVTLGVIVSSGLTAAGLLWADALAAGLVAGVVAFTGIRPLLRNAGALVDGAILSREAVGEIARRVVGVVSTSHVRSRGIPGAVAVDLRVQVEPTLSVAGGHQIAHAVADAVSQAFPDATDVVVHVEPADPGRS